MGTDRHHQAENISRPNPLAGFLLQGFGHAHLLAKGTPYSRLKAQKTGRCEPGPWPPAMLPVQHAHAKTSAWADF